MDRQTALDILEAFEPHNLVKEETSFWFNDQYEAIKMAEEALKNELKLEDQIEDLEEELDILDDAYIDAKDEIKGLEREIKELNATIDKQAIEIAKLKDLVAHYRSETGDKI